MGAKRFMKYTKLIIHSYLIFLLAFLSCNNNVQAQPITPPFDTAMLCHQRDAATYQKLIQINHPAQPLFTCLKKQYDTYVRYVQKFPQTERIPKIIHQIWIGPKPFPENCKKWQESWLKLNPDWEYKLWTNKDLKYLTLENQKYYDEEQNWGAKSDILRYEILYQFGGLYVDVDFECIQPFDWLHQYCDFYAGLLEVKRLKNTARLANGIIACSQYHPLLEKLIEEIPNYRFEKDLLRRVGPDFFTTIVHKYIQSIAGINIIFPANFFFSWSLDQILLQPETMAIHYYAGTWH